MNKEILVAAPLLIVDDLGMRKLPRTAAEELLDAMPQFKATAKLGEFLSQLPA